MPYRTRHRVRHEKAARIIQKHWRRAHKRWGNTDPITLCPLSYPSFVHVSATPPHSETLFSPRALTQFIEQSGDRRNPLTRESFTSVDILRLQHLARAKGYDNDIFNTIKTLEENRQERERQNTLLEFVCGEVYEVASEIRDVIHDANSRLASVIHHLQSNLFPTFSVGAMRVHSVRPSELAVVMERSTEIIERSTSGDFVHEIAAMITRSFLRTTTVQIRTQSMSEFLNYDGQIQAPASPTLSADRRRRRLQIVRRRVIFRMMNELESA
jgi:hypothetical protein